MSQQPHPVHSANRGYEHRDIGISGVLYFLLGLAIAGVFVYFIVEGIYSILQRRFDAEQAPISPLVTNAPKDTRKLPVDYRDYLKQNFPSPQLEIDERSQLDKVRIDEEQTLSSYDWVDQKAGTLRIPIDRAMDLLVQRGLPVRQQAGESGATASNDAAGRAANQTKGKKK